VFDDDGFDIFNVIFLFHHLLNFSDLFIDVLHGALGLPLHPVEEAVRADHLDPPIHFPAWVGTDEEIGDFVRYSVPDVVRHTHDGGDTTHILSGFGVSILRQELFVVGSLRRFQRVERDHHLFHP